MSWSCHYPVGLYISHTPLAHSMPNTYRVQMMVGEMLMHMWKDEDVRALFKKVILTLTCHVKVFYIKAHPTWSWGSLSVGVLYTHCCLSMEEAELRHIFIWAGLRSFDTGCLDRLGSVFPCREMLLFLPIYQKPLCVCVSCKSEIYSFWC